jgi:hypothetical protein
MKDKMSLIEILNEIGTGALVILSIGLLWIILIMLFPEG